jgi:hypothetical protein
MYGRGPPETAGGLLTGIRRPGMGQNLLRVAVTCEPLTRCEASRAERQRRMAALGALVLEGRAGAAQSLGCLRPGLFPPPLSLCWWRGSACST